MTYRFRPQPSGKLVLVVFEGEISPEEERQAILDYGAAPGVDRTADVLVDRSRATMTVHAADVVPHLEIVRSVWGSGEPRPKMAVVAPEDADFGMARMFELIAGDDLPHRLMVVRNLDDACEWLEIDKDEIEWP